MFAALSGLFKSGERNRLRTQVVTRVFEGVMAAIPGNTSTTQRKLSVKLAQRCLPPNTHTTWTVLEKRWP